MIFLEKKKKKKERIVELAVSYYLISISLMVAKSTSTILRTRQKEAK
jgi:hypothetical protein